MPSYLRPSFFSWRHGVFLRSRSLPGLAVVLALVLRVLVGEPDPLGAPGVHVGAALALVVVREKRGRPGGDARASLGSQALTGKE